MKNWVAFRVATLPMLLREHETRVTSFDYAFYKDIDR